MSEVGSRPGYTSHPFHDRVGSKDPTLRTDAMSSECGGGSSKPPDRVATSAASAEESRPMRAAPARGSHDTNSPCTIRAALPADRAGMYQVCLETGDEGA